VITDDRAHTVTDRAQPPPGVFVAAAVLGGVSFAATAEADTAPVHVNSVTYFEIHSVADGRCVDQDNGSFVLDNQQWKTV
jgi:hypothetical protein